MKKERKRQMAGRRLIALFMAAAFALCACGGSAQQKKDAEAVRGGSAAGGDKTGKEDVSARDDASRKGEEDKDNGSLAAGGGTPEFSVKFGNVEITQLPISVSVLEDDGWSIEYADAGLSYASKDGSYVAFLPKDGARDRIGTLYIVNGNVENGVFDISELTIFGSIPFAEAMAADIVKVIDPDRGGQGVWYECRDFDDYYYMFDFYNVKGMTSCGFMRENERDFNFYLSCEPLDDEKTASDSGSVSGAQEREKSELVEERLYQSDYNESLHIYVAIYDNGVWQMEQHRGGGDVYASYSYAKESAGEYVQVDGYNLAGAQTEFFFLGFAKFIMTEDTLTVQYKDGDEEIYNRIPLDSEIG